MEESLKTKTAAEQGMKSPSKPAGPPKWEEKARERVSQAIKRFRPVLEQLRARDVVEADTRHLVTDILCEMLGYDKYEDLTAEYSVKGEYADYGIRLNKQIEAFVEVKRISTQLKSAHLRQVESYALKEGVEWAILTNAQVWQVYRLELRAGEKSDPLLVFEVDLLSEESKLAEKVSKMFLLTKEGLSKGRLTEHMKMQDALSDRTLKPILISNEVVEAVRKAVRSKTKQNVDASEVKSAISRIVT
jgi:predicted type IV restriction endonuclease